MTNSATANFADTNDLIPFKFQYDDLVEKTKGDYKFKGWVTSVFRKRSSGSPRYVVENADGICHIFNGEQLEKVT